MDSAIFHVLLFYVYSSFAIILMGKSKQVGLPSLSSSCLMIVVHVAFPPGATGLSAVFDCGISWSYSLTILRKQLKYI